MSTSLVDRIHRLVEGQHAHATAPNDTPASLLDVSTLATAMERVHTYIDACQQSDTAQAAAHQKLAEVIDACQDVDNEQAHAHDALARRVDSLERCVVDQEKAGVDLARRVQRLANCIDGLARWLADVDAPADQDDDAPPPRDGVALIAAERRRQVEVEDFDAYHDDDHTDGALAMAAACYALRPDCYDRKTLAAGRSGVPLQWPFDPEWWKPTPDDRVRELVKAGALLAAEIDRVQRAAGAAGVDAKWDPSTGRQFLMRARATDDEGPVDTPADGPGDPDDVADGAPNRETASWVLTTPGGDQVRMHLRIDIHAPAGG